MAQEKVKTLLFRNHEKVTFFQYLASSKDYTNMA